jgi:3'-5' exoribonuclease
VRADWKPGEQVPKAALVVREAERKQKKDGAPYLVLQLGDKSGRVEAVLWDDADREAECKPGTVLLVKGTYEEHPKYGGRLNVEFWRPAVDGEYDLDELAEGPNVPVENLEGVFWDYFRMVNGPAGVLLDTAFDVNGDETSLWPLFRVAPAARRNHEAYRHGLLEHTVQVASTVAQMAGPTIDLSVALAGALLHDVGKVDAYTIDPFSVELTDAGRLFGEIPCGFYRVRQLIQENAATWPKGGLTSDEWTLPLNHILHIILSHHGQLEHGSPVRPCTREAALVHAADMFCAQMGAYARLEKGLRPGEAWAPWDKMVRGEAWFPARDIVVDAEVVDDPESQQPLGEGMLPEGSLQSAWTT